MVRSSRAVRLVALPVAAAILGALLLVGISAGPTEAATSHASTTTTVPPTGIAATRTQLAAAVAVRQTALHRVLAAVAASTTLVPADRSLLNGTLDDALTGMNSLAAKIPTDTTQAELTADQTTMVQTYRVLALQVPVADLVIAADQAAAIENRIFIGEPGIQQQLSPAANKGTTVPASATTAFTDMQHQILTAQATITGVSESLLSLLPSGYPGNASVITAAQTDLVNAHRYLGACQRRPGRGRALHPSLSPRWP